MRSQQKLPKTSEDNGTMSKLAETIKSTISSIRLQIMELSATKKNKKQKKQHALHKEEI